MTGFGERLYKLRNKNNMSQGDLANKLDVSRQTISNWIDRLSRIGYIHIDKNTECVYYAITKTADGKKHYKEILREVYCKGWNLYWSNKNEVGTNTAYKMMYDYVGGHPTHILRLEI